MRSESMCDDTGEISAAPATSAPTTNTYMSERAAMPRSARSRFWGPLGARRPRRSRVEGFITPRCLIGTGARNLHRGLSGLLRRGGRRRHERRDQGRQSLGLVLHRERPRALDQLEARVAKLARKAAAVGDRE